MTDRQVALVTGCSEGGLGSFLWAHFNELTCSYPLILIISCQKLAERGCIVYATARSVGSMRTLEHAEIKTLPLDVTNEGQVQSVVKTIVENEGRIDIVINNAGILEPG